MSINGANSRRMRGEADEARAMAEAAQERLATIKDRKYAAEIMACWERIIRSYEILEGHWSEAALSHLVAEETRDQPAVNRPNGR